MNKMLIPCIGLLLLTGAMGTAMADSGNGCRWERLIMGAGTLLLLNEILDQPTSEFRFRGHPCRRGRWEIRRCWIPPDYRNVWREGHYNGRCRWIPGRWARIKTRDGYYQNRRVRINCP